MVVEERRLELQTLEDLMARYQQADETAPAELISRVSPRLLSFFSYRSSSSSADAADLFQECWLRIHKARHTFRPGEPVLPWIFAIARHTRVDNFRRRRRIELYELAVENLEQLPKPQESYGADSARDLTALLQDLPDSQREVILMLKVTGMSLEEVARATGSTVGAVKQKAHRAYKTLRRKLVGKSPAVGAS